MSSQKKLSFKEWIRYWYRATIKTRIARAQIKIKNKRKSLRLNKKSEINNMQKSIIDFFLFSLKHKDATLNYSPESKTRFITLGNVWATMHSSGNNTYLINIIDESIENEAHSHEVIIPYEYAVELMDEFDSELEKRFRAMEAAKKNIVVDEIARLINKINNDEGK